MDTTPHTDRHLTASMVVFDVHTQTVLLVHHRITGFWQCPGGHVEPGEDPAQAAMREVAEETGVVGLLAFQRPVDLPGMRSLPVPWLVNEVSVPADHRAPAHTHVDFLFIGMASSQGTLTPAGDEVHSARWVRLVDVERMGVRPDVPKVVRMAWQRLDGHLTERVTSGNSGIQVLGSGTVTIDGAAFGPGATVIHK